MGRGQPQNLYAHMRKPWTQTIGWGRGWGQKAWGRGWGQAQRGQCGRKGDTCDI